MLPEKGRYPQGINNLCLTINIPEGVSKNIVLLHSTENNLDIAELWLMLAALRREGVASISLINTYAGYSRQDKVFKDGEGVSAFTMLKVINALTDNHFVLNVHYGNGSGRIDFSGIGLYNLNAFVQVAEKMFDWLHSTLGLKGELEEFIRHPILILSPDDGASNYVREAAQLLEKYIKDNYPASGIKVYSGYMDKVRISPREVRIPPYILGEDKQKILSVGGVDLRDCWAFVIDDETSSGGTLLAAAYVLVKELGLSWGRVFSGVIHAKLARGLKPFETGIKAADAVKFLDKGYGIDPKYINDKKRLMPPQSLFVTKSVALPSEFPEEFKVSIASLVSYAVKKIITNHGAAGKSVFIGYHNHLAQNEADIFAQANVTVAFIGFRHKRPVN